MVGMRRRMGRILEYFSALKTLGGQMGICPLWGKVGQMGDRVFSMTYKRACPYLPPYLPLSVSKGARGAHTL